MNSLTFIGTGGARVMMARQSLATGGIWLEIENTRISLDPGPGALVHCTKQGFDPMTLDGIIISHRHLDHCGDINAMIEAMTQGGLHRRGLVFAPEDALSGDPVVLKYLRGYVQGVTALQPQSFYQVGGLRFQVSVPHQHGGPDTYGFIFDLPGGHQLCYIPDTAYFAGLGKFYHGDILVVSMLGLEPRNRIYHLSIPDIRLLVRQMQAPPKRVFLTHFGIQVWQAGPDIIAERLSQETGVQILAAHDGLRVTLPGMEQDSTLTTKSTGQRLYSRT